jgi:succinate dehydrogenase / fumarate reductase, flavoprotein subunit
MSFGPGIRTWKSKESGCTTQAGTWPSIYAALQRTESRGGHTRDDHPALDSSWRKSLLVCRVNNTEVSGPHIDITKEPQVPMRQDLLELFKVSELEKYYTEEELAEHPERRA